MRQLSITFVSMLLASQALAAPPRERLNTTLEDLEQSKRAAAALQEKTTVSERQLEAMQNRAADLAERLQVSERRVSKQETALASTNAQLASKQREFDARKADYARTVVNLLRLREVPPTALFTDAQDIRQLMQAAAVLERTNAALAAQAAQLKTDMAQLRGLRSEATTRDASTRKERATLQAEQEKLARELLQRQQAHKQLSADQAAAESKVADLSRQSASLADLIGKLEEERQTRPVKPKASSGTASLGSLRAPVVGELIHRFGEHKNANDSWRGVVMQTRPKATVVSPADGEVVFTGPFRDYGTMVLIKHKSGLITLVAGLGEVKASLNQPVLRGEPVGVMPASPLPQAYIELRDKESKPIDPAGGFANLDGK